MSLLYFLEGLRNPVLDGLFSAITLLGEETVFMAVGMLIFWCFDKFGGYYLLCTGFLGTVTNQFLKMLFRIPRPWIKDPGFTIVESARSAATGYSFPSGHTQSAVGLFGGIIRWNKNALIKWSAFVPCVLVPLSRMYLGVHTPADVIVSLIVAAVLIFGLYPVFKRAAISPKTMYAVLFSLTAITVAFLCFVYLFPFPDSVFSDANIHNLLSAQKNGFTLLGCILGLIVVYTADSKFIHFPTEAVWWAQIIKTVVGLLLVIAVKELLRAPLEMVFGANLAARCIRYFFVVITGGIIWPLTFKWFSKLGKKTKEVHI